MGLLGVGIMAGKALLKSPGARRIAGGLLKATTGISIAGMVRGAVKSSGGAPPLPPITGIAGGTGNTTYGGNIRAAAEARGMRVVGSRSYRRMNPANIKALRRSIRRIGSAKKVFAQVFSAVHGHQPQKVRPKFGRKK